MRLKSLHSTEGGQGVRPQTASASHSARVAERRASVSADEVSLLIEESLNRIMANRAKQWIGRWKDIGLDPAWGTIMKVLKAITCLLRPRRTSMPA